METILSAIEWGGWLESGWGFIQILIGFSAIIFVHELGHFMAARWAGVRVEKFCIGFGKELFGFTRGETRYGFNILPLGGYVKMMGQEDFEIDKSGEISVKDDPRAFSNKPVGHRMIIISAGVIMNVIFAALLFMIVFMMGKEVPVAEIGYVKPGSPAAEAGFEVGDVIKEIDGSKINDFNEISMAVLLAEPHEPLDFLVERDGRLTNLSAVPINDKERNTFSVGIGPAMTPRLVQVGPEFDPTRPDHPHVDDVLVSVDGQPLTDDNANEMMYRVLSEPEGKRVVEVERADIKDPNAPPSRHQVQMSPRLTLEPADPTDPDRVDLLGLTPLVRVRSCTPNSRAELAGMRSDDVILKWGGVHCPTRTEIGQVVAESPEIDIPIRVRRFDGRVEDLTVRPRLARKWFRRSDRPTIGATLDLIADDVMRVGRTVAEVDGRPTPAAEAGIPTGALLKKVDGQEVPTWRHLVEALRAKAGGSVALEYETPDGRNSTADFRVPSTLRTSLGLPVYAKILAVNGKTSVELEIAGRRRMARVNYPLALREALQRNLGEEVEVDYAESTLAERKTARVRVTEEMLDPWDARIGYAVDVAPATATAMLQTSNPFVAMTIGIKKTVYFIVNVYETMQRMIFSRSVGVDTLSGPVGIIKIGTDSAKQGLPHLLFLLAILSANLAVINFLPLPIVDGGLMVFLIIEKIKGTPVSIKTQVVTQVIGLALIVLAFVFITFQDVLRITGGSL